MAISQRILHTDFTIAASTWMILQNLRMEGGGFIINLSLCPSFVGTPFSGNISARATKKIAFGLSENWVYPKKIRAYDDLFLNMSAAQTISYYHILAIFNHIA